MVAIHQIWISFDVFDQRTAVRHVFKTSDLPSKYLKCMASWRALANVVGAAADANTYTLWTTRTAALFLEKFAPTWLDVYWALPFAVMRTDLLRLLLVYEFGGVYADVDVEIRHGQGAHASALLNALEPGVDVLLSPIRCLGNGASPLWIPNNDLIAVAAPRHAFLERVLQMYRVRFRDTTLARSLANVSEIAKTYYVASLGPLLLHKVYRRLKTPPPPAAAAAVAAAAAAAASLRFLIFPKVRVANTMLVAAAKNVDADTDADADADVFIDCSDGTWFSGTSWFSFNRFVVEFLAIIIFLTAVVMAVVIVAARRRRRRSASTWP